MKALNKNERGANITLRTSITPNQIEKTMKKVIVSLAVMFLLTIAAEGSYVVFDNGVPEVYSDGKDMRSWLQADDFSITQNVILTSACFWTYEHDDQIWDGTLEYFIFDDDDGIPDTIIASGHGQGIQKDVTYETPIGTQYKYSFEFEEPINISSDDTYWFGLHLASDYPNDGGNVFKWESCISGFGLTSFESEGGTLDNWVDSGIHRAFYLEAVPEPGTLSLFSLGVLVLMRKRGMRDKRQISY